MIRATVDRLAQPADVHVDQVALRIEVQVPHALEQHGARHHLAGAAHEELEELELARGELDLAPGARHAPRQQVELQVLDLEARRLRCARAPAQQRLDARQQLSERERLGEIVVAPGLQSPDTVVDAAEGRQHQHRRGQPLAAHQLDDRQPIDVRQHPVGDHQVELPLGGAEQALAAVGGVIDAVAALAQAFHQEARGLGVVFDEE